MTERVRLPLAVDADDIERLVDTSMRWGEDWRAQADRFEHATADPDTPPSYRWALAYWVGTSWLNVVAFRSYLEGIAHPLEILWDTALGPDGSAVGYVVLTDWHSPVWRPADAQAER